MSEWEDLTEEQQTTIYNEQFLRNRVERLRVANILLRQENQWLRSLYKVGVIRYIGGNDLIARERQRQIDVLGYTPQFDDQHDQEQLASAAAFYALPEKYGDLLSFWPFGDDPVRRRKPRIRQLAIAGALIAAEIDRLIRAESVTKEEA